MPKCIVITREETFHVTGENTRTRVELWHPHRQLAFKSHTFEGGIKLILNGMEISDRNVSLRPGETKIVTLENIPFTPIATWNEACYSNELRCLPVDMRTSVLDFSRIDNFTLKTDAPGSFTLESEFYTWIQDTADVSQISDARIFLDPTGLSCFKTIQYAPEYDYVSTEKSLKPVQNACTFHEDKLSVMEKRILRLEQILSTLVPL